MRMLGFEVKSSKLRRGARKGVVDCATPWPEWKAEPARTSESCGYSRRPRVKREACRPIMATVLPHRGVVPVVSTCMYSNQVMCRDVLLYA